jgi:hypothetical protein
VENLFEEGKYFCITGILFVVIIVQLTSAHTSLKDGITDGKGPFLDIFIFIVRALTASPE